MEENIEKGCYNCGHHHMNGKACYSPKSCRVGSNWIPLVNNLKQAHVSVSLPSTDELYLKAKHYTDVQCNLQNFFDEDEIEISRMRYMHGYEQAIKDFVNCNYNPDLQ